MTLNEFKLCCICFCKKYDGKCLGEIFEDIVPSISKLKISTKNIQFGVTSFRIDGYTILDFCNNKIQYVQRVENNDKISSRWSDVDMSLFVFDDIV